MSISRASLTPRHITPIASRPIASRPPRQSLSFRLWPYFQLVNRFINPPLIILFLSIIILIATLIVVYTLYYTGSNYDSNDFGVQNAGGLPKESMYLSFGLLLFSFLYLLVIIIRFKEIGGRINRIYLYQNPPLVLTFQNIIALLTGCFSVLGVIGIASFNIGASKFMAIFFAGAAFVVPGCVGWIFTNTYIDYLLNLVTFKLRVLRFTLGVIQFVCFSVLGLLLILDTAPYLRSVLDWVSWIAWLFFLITLYFSFRDLVDFLPIATFKDEYAPIHR